MERLTQEDIEAIRKRAEAATEGPWRNSLYKVRDSEWDYVLADPPRIEDADFIANARTDIPKLLAEVERLQTKLAEAVEQTCRFANVKCRKGESE